MQFSFPPSLQTAVSQPKPTTIPMAGGPDRYQAALLAVAQEPTVPKFPKLPDVPKPREYPMRPGIDPSYDQQIGDARTQWDRAESQRNSLKRPDYRRPRIGTIDGIALGLAALAGGGRALPQILTGFAGAKMQGADDEYQRALEAYAGQQQDIDRQVGAAKDRYGRAVDQRQMVERTISDGFNEDLNRTNYMNQGDQFNYQNEYKGLVDKYGGEVDAYNIGMKSRDKSMSELYKIPGGQNRVFRAQQLGISDPQVLMSLAQPTPMEMQQTSRAGLYDIQGQDMIATRPLRMGYIQGQMALIDEQAKRYKLLAPAELQLLQERASYLKRSQGLSDQQALNMAIRNQYQAALMRSQVEFNSGRNAIQMDALRPEERAEHAGLTAKINKARADLAQVESVMKAVISGQTKSFGKYKTAYEFADALELSRNALGKQLQTNEARLNQLEAQAKQRRQAPAPAGYNPGLDLRPLPMPMPDVPSGIIGPNNYSSYPQG
jgi:hypothetical protein